MYCQFGKSICPNCSLTPAICLNHLMMNNHSQIFSKSKFALCPTWDNSTPDLFVYKSNCRVSIWKSVWLLWSTHGTFLLFMEHIGLYISTSSEEIFIVYSYSPYDLIHSIVSLDTNSCACFVKDQSKSIYVYALQRFKLHLQPFPFRYTSHLYAF